MKPYGVNRVEIYEPFVKKGVYGRYNQTRSKLGYKLQCKSVKSRARQQSKRNIAYLLNENIE